MDTIMIIAVLFLTTINLFIGLVFAYFAYKVAGIEIPNLSKNKDKIEEIGENFTLRDQKVPIDQFMPRSDKPLKVVYSEKDTITKE